MLSRSFKPAKCSTALRLAVSRIKTLRNKRENQLRQMKRDLAQLLETGQEQTARIRVEHYLREEKTLAAYDIIQIYCELLIARMPIIESQKSIPIDLKEAISSVVFAAPRCTDIVELTDVRKHFTAKYGKDFVSAALELRPDCGVNRTVVEKLSAKTPDGETKIKILRGIAQEHNVKWDPKPFQEEVLKPPEDLLDGSSKFEGARKMPFESFHAQLQSSNTEFKSVNERFLASPGQTNDFNAQAFGNDVTSSSPSLFGSSGSGSMPKTSAPHAHPDPTFPASKIGGRGYGSPLAKDGNSLINRQSWNMEFKDATSAAQAAAESAEMASLAARAAAELSRGGTDKRHFSPEPHRSPYSEPGGDGDGLSGLTDSKGVHTENSVRKENDSSSSLPGIQTKSQSQQRDETHQDRILGGESKYNQRGSFTGRSSRSCSSVSSANSIDDEIPASIPRKVDEDISPSHQWKYNSRSNIPNAGSNQNPDQVTPKYGNDAFEPNLPDIRQSNSDTVSEHHGDRDYSSVVFDESASEGEDHLELEIDGGHRIFSSFPTQGRRDFSHLSANLDPWSPKKQSTFEKNTPTGQPIFRETEPISEPSSPSPSKNFLPATFDKSDTENSENELSRDYKGKERNGPSSLRHGEDVVSVNLHPRHTDRATYESPVYKKVERGSLKGKTVRSVLPSGETELDQKSFTHKSPPKFSSVHIPVEDLRSESEEKIDNFKQNKHNPPGSLHEMGGTFTGKPSQIYHGTHKSSGFKEKSRGMKARNLSSDDSESDDGHALNPRSETFSLTKEIMGVDKEPPIGASSSESSSYLSPENENRLNFGRLTGGLRNKGSTQPPYVRRLTEEKLVTESSANDEKLPSPLSRKSVARNEAREAESSGQKHQVEGHKKFNLKSSVAYFSSDTSDSDGDEAVLSHVNLNMRSHQGGLLSRKPRDSPPKSHDDSPPRSMGWFRDPTNTNEDKGRKPSQVGSSSKHKTRSATSVGEDDSNSADSGSLDQRSKAPSILKGSVESVEGSNTSKKGCHSTTRESSLKSATHVHPKLPDYDTLTAHLESLRSSRG